MEAEARRLAAELARSCTVTRAGRLAPAAAAPRPPPRPGSFPARLWAEPSVATVWPDASPPPPPAREPAVRLLLARRETGSFQVALRLGGGTEEERSPRPSVLVVNVAVPPPLRATVRAVRPVAGVPDALVPLEPLEAAPPRPGCLPVDRPPPGSASYAVRVEPGRTVSLWVSVAAPAGAAPGTYRGRVAAPGEGVDVAVAVSALALPATPSFPALVGVSEEAVERMHDLRGPARGRGAPAWQARLRAHSEFLLDYRVAPYFCRWGAFNAAMGVVTFSSPHGLGSPEALEETRAVLEDERLSCAVLPPCDPTAPGAPEQQTEAERAAVGAALARLLAAPAVRAKSVFYLYDEPSTLAEYGALRRVAAQVAEVAEGRDLPAPRVLTTYYCGPKDGPLPEGSFPAFLSVPEHLRDCTSVFCTSAWASGGRPESPGQIAGRLRPGEEWWQYVCMGPGPPEPNLHLVMNGFQHRAVLWRAWHEGARGFLYWSCNSGDAADTSAAHKFKAGADEEASRWVADRAEYIFRADAAAYKFRADLPAGDGVLLYPGALWGLAPESLVASVRLERLRESQQDLDLLELYAARRGRAAARALMARTVYRAPRSYARTAAGLEALRRQIFSELGGPGEETPR